MDEFEIVFEPPEDVETDSLTTVENHQVIEVVLTQEIDTEFTINVK